LRHALAEEHWSYMDGFADAMIARGPTFAADGDTLTGSVHILDRPDPAAARAFAFDEPGYQAGTYRDVLIRRYDDLLRRTMWDFPGDRDGDHCLVLALGPEPGTPPPLPAATERLIAYGSLLSDDGTRWLGTAALVAGPEPAQILAAHPYATVETHPWTFGGRPA
jgi:uncharacterized protein